MFDYLVVGAGFAGCVLAERLAADGEQSVLLIDRRGHVGGNAYDYTDDNGILVHKYGPHIFHTNSDEVVAYLSRFTSWTPYEHRVLTSVDGQLLPMPINRTTINGIHGLCLGPDEVGPFLEGVREPRSEIRTSEDVVVSKVGRLLYEKLFRGYTRKQWGLDPSELDATVAGRLPVRLDDDDRYFSDTFQAMPADGYTAMFERMVRHPRITVQFGTDFREVRAVQPARRTIFTGPIDEYFNHQLGRLPYRSLEFVLESQANASWQPVATVNYPNDFAYTRVTEFKKFRPPAEDRPVTTLMYEYPCSAGDPYYPIPRPENARLYGEYEKLAAGAQDVCFVGRLGTYRYYNMDQVTAQALATYRALKADRFGMAAEQLAYSD